MAGITELYPTFNGGIGDITDGDGEPGRPVDPAWFEDFGDMTSALEGMAWIYGWGATVMGVVPMSDPEHTSGQVFKTTTIDKGQMLIYAFEEISQERYADFDLVVRFNFGANGTNENLPIFFRSVGDGYELIVEQSYSLYLSPDSIYGCNVNFGWSSLTWAALGIELNTNYACRLRVQGNNIKVRVWEISNEPEPETWGIDFDDTSSVEKGIIGIGTLGSDFETKYYDWISYAPGSGSADVGPINVGNIEGGIRFTMTAGEFTSTSEGYDRDNGIGSISVAPGNLKRIRVRNNSIIVRGDDTMSADQFESISIGGKILMTADADFDAFVGKWTWDDTMFMEVDETYEVIFS